MQVILKEINKAAFFLTLFVLASLVSADILARSREAEETKSKAEPIGEAQALPFAQQRVHRMSQVNACMTNWATVGSQMRDPYTLESAGGCFMDHPDSEAIAPSFEFPAGSGLEHLFHGGMWIGAIVDDFVYTSVGCDGWYGINEMWPDAFPRGAVIEISVKPNVFCYSPDAISDQDIIAVYADTSANIPTWDPWDNRKHHPLDVRITQKSYSWNTPAFDKFIIAEYTIENIGTYLLSQMYVGFYMDADVMQVDEDPYGPYGYQDDITGFLRQYEVLPGDIRVVNIAWAADNDGHGDADGGAGTPYFTDQSPRSVVGIRLLRYPNPEVQISYNWWISNVYGSPGDWGPWKAANQAVWEQMNPYGSGYTFPDNALGTPGGDVSKYFIMSNGEIDYDQIYSCVWPEWHPSEGWLPVNETECEDFADGLDTRFLLSFGPLDQIASGESLCFAVAFVIGETLHVDPLNFAENFSDEDPGEFHSNLDFSGLVNNALIAESLYYDILYSAVPGDANCDGQVDIEDAIHLITYLFLQGNPPLPLWAGDINGDCVVDIADVIYLIDYLFLNGSPPQVGCA
jgi:hypothetical protein